jgi:hypothetical protein
MLHLLSPGKQRGVIVYGAGWDADTVRHWVGQARADGYTVVLDNGFARLY